MCARSRVRTVCLRYCFHPRAMKNACRTEAHTKGIWGASDSVQESATPRSCHARRSMSFQTLHKCCRILTSRSNVHCPGEMRRQFDGNQNSIKRGQESTAGKWGGRGDLAGRDVRTVPAAAVDESENCSHAFSKDALSAESSGSLHRRLP